MFPTYKLATHKEDHNCIPCHSDAPTSKQPTRMSHAKLNQTKILKFTFSRKEEERYHYHVPQEHQGRCFLSPLSPFYQHRLDQSLLYPTFFLKCTQENCQLAPERVKEIYYLFLQKIFTCIPWFPCTRLKLETTKQVGKLVHRAKHRLDLSIHRCIFLDDTNDDYKNYIVY